LSSCEASLLLCVFLRFFFIVVISFSLHVMLPLLVNKDAYKSKKSKKVENGQKNNVNVDKFRRKRSISGGHTMHRHKNLLQLKNGAL